MDREELVHYQGRNWTALVQGGRIGDAIGMDGCMGISEYCNTACRVESPREGIMIWSSQRVIDTVQRYSAKGCARHLSCIQSSNMKSSEIPERQGCIRLESRVRE